MRTMPISEFKSHALATMDQVASTKESVIVTKRGKPLVRVVPFEGSERVPIPGKLAHTLLFEKDIVSPLGEEDWEACR